MNIESLELPEVKLIKPRVFRDERGAFLETWRDSAFRAHGIGPFVQDNMSISRLGVVRGLHFQLEPYAQDKLVRVVRGAILDVAVDLRRGSPTFGQHVSARLDAETGRQILVPAGFAHGFVTLEPDTEVIYKVTNFYAPSHDRGLLWNDPDLGIEWPVSAEEAILSDKDKVQPRLRDLPDTF